MAKIALITGASRGIGRAIALSLAEDGYSIWLNYRTDEAKALETKKEVEARRQDCYLLPFDVSSFEAVKSSLSPLLSKAVPEVLVNNAGFTRDTIFGFMEKQDWESVIDVHLGGFYNVTREIVPHMIHARRGRIISIASVSGQAGNPGQVNYSAAKAGLIGATKALARELGKRGILVNAVAPGLIETEMTKDFAQNKEYINAIPLKRMGKAEDVANCVRFLCSDWASYITGQVISVNGGLYM